MGGGLYRIRVEKHARLTRHLADLGNGVNRTHFIVGINHRHENRIVPYCILYLLRCYHSIFIYR